MGHEKGTKDPSGADIFHLCMSVTCCVYSQSPDIFLLSVKASDLAAPLRDCQSTQQLEHDCTSLQARLMHAY